MTEQQAMRMALEALRFGLHVGFDESSETQIKKGSKAFDQHNNAITALRQALEQQPADEPKFISHEVTDMYDWSEWVNPNNDSYMMKCCDCGLVHEMQFKVAKYSEGDECEFFDDPDLQPIFRARRAEEAWQEKDTAHRAGGMPHPAALETEEEKPWVCECGAGSYNSCKCVFKALEQHPVERTADEPVAWMWYVNNGAGYVSRGIGFHQTAIPFAKHTPLYTRPQPAAWVGLTDEEIDQGLCRTNYAMQTAGAWRDGVGWAMNQLKERNNG